MTDSNNSSVSHSVLRVTGVDAAEFTRLAAFKDLPHWDSLSLMQLLSVIENDLQIELTVDEVMSLTPARVRELYENN